MKNKNSRKNIRILQSLKKGLSSSKILKLKIKRNQLPKQKKKKRMLRLKLLKLLYVKHPRNGMPGQKKFVKKITLDLLLMKMVLFILGMTRRVKKKQEKHSLRNTSHPTAMKKLLERL